MSAIEITTQGPSTGAGPDGVARPRRCVVAVYESRAEGREAILRAHAVAAAAGVPLAVIAVASRERTDVGCGPCRQGAAFRNELACEFAVSDLAEARHALADAPGDVDVDYALARGSFVAAVLGTTARRDADLIVIPARRPGRLRRLLSPDRARRLRRRTSAAVLVVAPG